MQQPNNINLPIHVSPRFSRLEFAQDAATSSCGKRHVLPQGHKAMDPSRRDSPAVGAGHRNTEPRNTLGIPELHLGSEGAGKGN